MATILAVKFLSGGYLAIYFSGILIALTTVLIELPNRAVVAEILSDSIIEDRFSAHRDESGSKYPSYSLFQMKMIEWETNNFDLLSYRGLAWECSVCTLWNKLEKDVIVLKGSGRRFVVQCPACDGHSIVRLSGFLNLRLTTEARLPDYREEYHLRNEQGADRPC